MHQDMGQGRGPELRDALLGIENSLRDLYAASATGESADVGKVEDGQREAKRIRLQVWRQRADKTVEDLADLSRGLLDAALVFLEQLPVDLAGGPGFFL